MKKKEKNIYDIAKPFYFALNCFGLACFEIDKNSGVLRTTKLNKCIFAVFYLFWGWMNYFRFNRATIFETGAKSEFLDEILGYQYRLQHYLGVLILVYNFAQRKHVGNLLQSLDNFDRFSQILGWGFKHRSNFVNSMIAFLVLSLTILLLHCVETIFLIPRLTVTHLIIFVQIMLFFLVISQQFTISVNSVSVRLTHLSENFE